MIVTIDGGVATGTTTLARNLSISLGLPRLDSGSLYRAINLLALADKVTADGSACASLAQDAQIEMPDGEAITVDGHVVVEWVDGQRLDRLHTAQIDQCVPVVAGHESVREVVNRKQREFASINGAVVDGRDAGTVVFPEAEVKLFLTVSDKEAARRRSAADGRIVTVEEIRQRNEADRNHKYGALAKPKDAVEIDTNDLDAGQVAELALSMIHSKQPPSS